MKQLSLLALPLVLLASVAQARPSTYKMTCADAADTVRSSRGVVMNYGYHEKAGHLYEMFYPSARFCESQGHQDGQRAYVNTTDNERCFIGYVCVPSSHNH